VLGKLSRNVILKTGVTHGSIAEFSTARMRGIHRSAQNADCDDFRVNNS
jgi:hypothetical protein